MIIKPGVVGPLLEEEEGGRRNWSRDARETLCDSGHFLELPLRFLATYRRSCKNRKPLLRRRRRQLATQLASIFRFYPYREVGGGKGNDVLSVEYSIFPPPISAIRSAVCNFPYRALVELVRINRYWRRKEKKRKEKCTNRIKCCFPPVRLGGAEAAQVVSKQVSAIFGILWEFGELRDALGFSLTESADSETLTRPINISQRGHGCRRGASG